jgi:hypothetical protein
MVVVTLSTKPCFKLLKLVKKKALPLALGAGLAFLVLFWQNLLALVAFNRVCPWSPAGGTLPGPADGVQSLEVWAARQSTTVGQATQRYRDAYAGREPPPGFEAFFRYATERRCFVDEYAALQAMLDPLRALGAQEYQRRLAALLRSPPHHLALLRVEGGKVRVLGGAGEGIKHATSALSRVYVRGVLCAACPTPSCSIHTCSPASHSLTVTTSHRWRRRFRSR